MHGQEITDEIEKRKGVRPSPGTIYPALKHLKEIGFIKEKKQGKIITYTLAKEGEKAFKIAKVQFCRIFIDVI